MMFTKGFSRKCVLFIGQIFATNFSKMDSKSPGKHKVSTIKVIFGFQIVYLFFDVLLIFLTFPSDMSMIKLQFNFVLHMYQVMLPQLIKFLVVYQAFKEQNQQRHIEMELKNIKEFIKRTFRKNYVKNRQSKAAGIFVKHFLIIIFTRIVKLCTIKYTVYTFSTAISEFTLSSNDLLFTFYVDYLKELNQMVNCSLKSKKQIVEKEIKSLRIISKRIFNISNKILSRYSLSLLSIAGFNFGISIINLYWLFMRLSFGYLKELGGEFNIWIHNHLNFKIISFIPDYATFLYFIQPCLCLYTVFSSCSRCVDEYNKIAPNLHALNHDSKYFAKLSLEPLSVDLITYKVKFIAYGMLELNMSSLCDVKLFLNIEHFYSKILFSFLQMISTTSEYFLLMIQVFNKNVFE